MSLEYFSASLAALHFNSSTEIVWQLQRKQKVAEIFLAALKRIESLALKACSVSSKKILH